jgi:hypothetical protein
MSIAYQVASSTGHYVAARNLMKEEGAAPVNLAFPTILAFETEPPGLVGMLGTHHQDELIIAGPLVLESSFPRIKTALHLCEQYEHAMRTLGIKSFIMHVKDDTIMAHAIERYEPPGLEHYATEGDTKFYIRRL